MVYLIHLDEKMSHAQHYIGWTQSEKTLQARVDHHKAGCGSRFLRAAALTGIEFSVVRVWNDGDKHFERRLKNAKKASMLCPVCNPQNWANHFKETRNE